MRGRLELLVVLVAILSGCDLYEDGLVDRVGSGGTGGISGAGGGGESGAGQGGGAGHPMCSEGAVEQCNGWDDDCDGRTDEKPEADTWCANQLPNVAAATCSSGACLMPVCEPSWCACTGDPSDGCGFLWAERTDQCSCTPPVTEMDAGSTGDDPDAGIQDAGILDAGLHDAAATTDAG